MSRERFRRILKYEELVEIRNQFFAEMKNCRIGSLPKRLKEKNRDRNCYLFDEDAELRRFDDVVGILKFLEAHYILDRLLEMRIEPIEYYTEEDNSDILYVVAKRNSENYGFYLREYMECHFIIFVCVQNEELVDKDLALPAAGYSGTLQELLDILRERR